MGHEHSHRAPKTAAGWGECALLAAFTAGGAAAFYSYHLHHIRTRDGIEFVDMTRFGGSALAIGAGAMLLAWFAHRWLAEARKTWEVKRQARRAVLITPAPVIDRIQELEARQAQADAERAAAVAQIGNLIATFADVLGDKAPGLQETMPLPLRLIARDGQIVSKDEKDSA